ncbi:MAG TPA: CRISPR-associated helicase Cas3' [Treponemataceae bacterium]|nr:CRISPR-associated helicase Cas3' [Treponemataceae bacterium]
MHTCIAHVRKIDEETWDKPQLLFAHLMGTSNKAQLFAESFKSGGWGSLCGLFHDIGKGTEEWQRYIRLKSGYNEEAHLEGNPGRVDHSSPSAKMVEDVFGKNIGRVLAYCIAGHHTGLPDWTGSQSSLSFRLQNTTTTNIFLDLIEKLDGCETPTVQLKFNSHGLDMSLWIRMLFSCLVDADFLDTEEYMDINKSRQRVRYANITELLQQFNKKIKVISQTALSKNNTPVNQARQQVLLDCRNAAELNPGLFSITVPTGGGKTLSSMAFALEHANRYNKDRIIYVIPYTSIIEQNADVFRSVFGKEQVVEHHSNLDINETTAASRLAAENWDAPLIVTTTVQFFESFFSAKTSRCRKLHNIVNSVIIFDEAQLIPIDFLEPILETLNLLVTQYHCSVVFCTATQPVFEIPAKFPRFPGFAPGIIREIISDVPSLYAGLRRVKVKKVDTKNMRTWEELSDELSSYERVLCIVSDRKSCRELHSLMPEGTYHLSALLCPQHRSDIIKEIKEKLKGKGTIRVISTQLVEAGVDIDFPVVYRAMAGLDSIAQAAGRCNREGLLENSFGKVVVFVPPRKAPVGMLRKASETASSLFNSGLEDVLDHESFKSYFTELYWKANSFDSKGIMNLLRPDPISELGIQFRTAARQFKIIDDSMQRTILVPYNEGKSLILLLEKSVVDRQILRKLQRYAVNIYTNQFTKLLNRGSLKEISVGVFALKCSVEYDKNIGLLVDELPSDPETFISC